MGGAPQMDNLPVAATLGPPEWVKPGVRISYYLAAASVAQSRFSWIEDPNGKYVDPATGKRYRRTDETGESMGGGGSGDGVLQIDVVAIEGKEVALSHTSYGIDHEFNRFVPGITSVGGKFDGVTGGAWWIHPTELAKLETMRLENIIILVGKYTLNGTRYDSISFASLRPDSYHSYTYDKKTGRLLTSTTKSVSGVVPGQTQSPTELTVAIFAGVRQRNMPGITGRNPAWVARTNKLQYQGTYEWVNPRDPTTGNVSCPMNMTLALTKGGDRWSTFSADTSIQSPCAWNFKGTGITASTGLYWWDVSALKGMRANKVLDEDPVTKERIVVKGVETRSSHKVVIIESSLAGIKTTTAYDQAGGALLSYKVEIAANGTTVQLDLGEMP
jgi:hypothetical protein